MSTHFQARLVDGGGHDVLADIGDRFAVVWLDE
jgi:hypothetical protein